MELTTAAVAKRIDHALLRPELTVAEVEQGCDVAVAYAVAAVCVRPCDVPLAAERVAGSDVAVCTVIGFPHGSSTTATKVHEAGQALGEGAAELDMVLAISRLRSALLDEVRDDIAAVCAVAHGAGASVKVILENAYLSDDEKRTACALAEAAGADYVKTSTGFAPSGATLDDLRLMRAAVSPAVRIKAAGGVRTLDDLLAILALGVDRVGASGTAALLDELRARRGESA